MIRYYLSKILGIILPRCPRDGSGCEAEDDSYGRSPCIDTRGWIDGERCAYYSQHKTGILERLSGRVVTGIERMEGIKDD